MAPCEVGVWRIPCPCGPRAVHAASSIASMQHYLVPPVYNFPYSSLPTKTHSGSGGYLGLSQPLKTLVCLQSKVSRAFPVRASGKEEKVTSRMAPFQPESRIGQYLAELLVRYPDLVPAAAEQELLMLGRNRELDARLMYKPFSKVEQALNKRIAEVKVQERHKALEEIMYFLIVQKFVEAGIPMISSVSCLSSIDKLWPLQIEDLESVHSFEALELIREHSLLVLGKRGTTDFFSQSLFAHMSKQPIQQLYAASAVYGYFLKRLHNRFHLEKSVGSTRDEVGSLQGCNEADKDVAAAMAILNDLRGANKALKGTGVMTSKFLAYIMSFDVETLQRFATIRFTESQSIMKKHTWALFSGADAQISSDKEGTSRLSFLKSKTLLLEAVAFGSFLWDVETFVDTQYGLEA